MNEKLLKDLVRELTRIRRALERIAGSVGSVGSNGVSVDTDIGDTESAEDSTGAPNAGFRDRAVEAVSDALIKRFCAGLINGN